MDLISLYVKAIELDRYNNLAASLLDENKTILVNEIEMNKQTLYVRAIELEPEDANKFGQHFKTKRTCICKWD